MKQWAIIILCLIIMVSTAWAGKVTYGTVVVEEITSVYDGDTFRCNVSGWPSIAGQNIGVRIYGIDTPEIRGTTGKAKELAMAAKRLTEKMLTEASVVELRDIRRGKYFRVVADVYVDGVRLADILINDGLAMPYDGGKKTTW